MIEKIAGLGGLRNLKTLSLGRNYIKAFSGLVSMVFLCVCGGGGHIVYFSMFLITNLGYLDVSNKQK